MHLSDSKAFTYGLPGTYPAFDPVFPHRASMIAQLVKNLPAMQETLVQFLSREDPLEKG